MKIKRQRRAVFVVAVLMACVSSLWAQRTESFKTRLSPMPIDLTMQASITGVGSATAALAGTRVTVTGTFSGMKSAATTARVYRSVAAGVRGAPLFDLTVTRAASGSIEGSSTLTAYQIDDLRLGRLYVQIQSESAPDGNLRGWLMREELK